MFVPRETPVPLRAPGAGKTKKAYSLSWARSLHELHPGVIYEFCLGRGSHDPVAFLGDKEPPCPGRLWNGTLITDQYAGYNAVLEAKVYPQRRSALCAAHARQYFDELSRAAISASAVANAALRRWTRIWHAEAAFAETDLDSRRQARQQLRKPLFDGFEV